MYLGVSWVLSIRGGWNNIGLGLGLIWFGLGLVYCLGVGVGACRVWGDCVRISCGWLVFLGWVGGGDFLAGVFVGFLGISDFVGGCARWLIVFVGFASVFGG